MRSPFEQRESVLARIRAVAGVDPDAELARAEAAKQRMHELRMERANLMAQLRAFESYFERSGLASQFDHERRAILAQLALARRQELEGQKVTDLAGYLEEYAQAHESYRSWLRRKRDERAEMASIQARLAVAHAQLEDAIAEWTLARHRLDLVRSVIGFARAEATIGG